MLIHRKYIEKQTNTLIIHGKYIENTFNNCAHKWAGGERERGAVKGELERGAGKGEIERGAGKGGERERENGVK